MSYIKPNEVNTPKDKWQNKYVLYNEGESGFSIAAGSWNGKPSFGLRWNGTAADHNGFPISRNKPTWFILPAEDIAEELLKVLALQFLAGNNAVNEDNLRKHIRGMKEEGAFDFHGDSDDVSRDIAVNDESCDITERWNNNLTVGWSNAVSLGKLMLRWHGDPKGFPATQWFSVPNAVGISLLNILARFHMVDNKYAGKNDDNFKSAINFFFMRDDIEAAAHSFDERSFEVE